MFNNLKKLSVSSRNIIVLVTGTTLAQSIPIILSPILTRIYSPEEFGEFSVFMAIITILSVVATGRYEQAVMLPKKERDAVHIVILSLLIASCFSLIVLAVIVMCTYLFPSVVKENNLGDLIYFVPLSVFVVGSYNTFCVWNNRSKNYLLISQTKVMQTSGMSLTQLTLGNTKIWSSGLIIGWFTGQILALCLIFYKSIIINKIQLYKFNKLRMIALTYRYKDFPRVNTLSGFLNTSSLELPLLLISMLFGSAITGFFSLTQRILQMPMALIGNSVGQVYFEEATKLKDDKNAVGKLSITYLKRLACLGFIPTCVLILWGDKIFSFIFGNSWLVAGQYAQALSIWIFFVFICSPLSHLLTIYEKHWESVVFNLLLLVTRVSSLIFTWYFFKDPDYVVYVYGAVGAIVWCLFVFYLMKFINISYIETSKFLLPVILFLTSLHLVRYI